MMDIKQAVLSELETLPEAKQSDVLAFVRFLKMGLTDLEEMERHFDDALAKARAIAKERGITEVDIAAEIQAVRSSTIDN